MGERYFFIIVHIINGTRHLHHQQRQELSPELFFACFLHPALASGTRLLIPDTDVIAAALQAQPTDLAPVGWSDIGDDTTHDDVLNRLAVRTQPRRNLLTEQAAAFIHLGLVTAVTAAIFQFPGHDYCSTA